MGNRKKIDIKWTQIFITALLTGLVSLIVAILAFNYTNKKVELIFEKFPISFFKNDHTSLGIVNYSIKNIGDKKATNVLFSINLPKDAIIKEPNINLESKLTKYNILKNSNNSIIYKIETLYPNEKCNLSLLVENLKSTNNIEVELRSNEKVGNLFLKPNNEISPIFLYITITILIILIIIIFIFINIAKKARNAFVLLKNRLSKEADIEERKISDIITQGVDYCDMEMVDDSIRILLKGKYLYPEASSIHSNLARAYARKGDFNRAEIEYKIAEKLIEDDKDKLVYFYTKAHYYALKGDKRKMISFINKAKEIDNVRVLEKLKLDEEFVNFRDDKDFKKILNE